MIVGAHRLLVPEPGCDSTLISRVSIERFRHPQSLMQGSVLTITVRTLCCVMLTSAGTAVKSVHRWVNPRCPLFACTAAGTLLEISHFVE